MTKPLWHGWATPDDVRFMMSEMYAFLIENGELCPYTTLSAHDAELLRMSGRESMRFAEYVPSAERKQRD